MSGWHEAFVGLGSNLGDREARLREALDALERDPEIELVSRSRLYETEPVGPPQGRYLNAAVRLRTRLTPRQLLTRLLAMEDAAGRRRGPERNAPRTLDLDLLLYGDRRIDEPDLVVPHPRLHERAFVLEPLCELAPERVHPGLGVTLAELAARVRDPGAVAPYRSGDRQKGRTPWQSSR